MECWQIGVSATKSLFKRVLPTVTCVAQRVSNGVLEDMSVCNRVSVEEGCADRDAYVAYRVSSGVLENRSVYN